MSNAKIPREYKTLARVAAEQNWSVSATNGGHLRWRAPNGAIVFSSSSPSDVRAVRNLRSMLVRNGLKLER